MKWIVFTATVIITGLPLWLSSYSEYINHIWISGCSIAACGICAGILVFKTRRKKMTILLFAVAAQQAAFIVKTIIDCIPDRSNHNLVPFEMIFFIFADAVACTVGIAMGTALRQKPANK